MPASGAASVLLNVTVNQTTGAGGFVTVYPCGGTLPVASNLNFNGGDTVANLVSVPVGAEGKVCLYTNFRTDLIADVVGWFGTCSGGSRADPAEPTTHLGHARRHRPVRGVHRPSRPARSTSPAWAAFPPAVCRPW